MCEMGNLFLAIYNLPCGVREGGVLSPYLFAVYIDSVYKKVVSTAIGCYMKWTCVNIFLYADDILLIAPTVSALQHLLNVCESEFCRENPKHSKSEKQDLEKSEKTCFDDYVKPKHSIYIYCVLA